MPGPAASGASPLAAHRPPDDEQHQRQHAGGFEKEDPAIGQGAVSDRSSSIDSSLRRHSALRRHSTLRRHSALLAAGLLAFACCLPPAPAFAQTAGQQPKQSHPGAPALSPAAAPEKAVPVADLPGWRDDDFAGLAQALARQCELRKPPEPWPSLCAQLPSAAAGTDELRAWIERRFEAWPLVGANGETVGLITGYHEPLLSGSRERETPDQVPLFRRPDDLSGEGATRWQIANGERRPYPSRAEIENLGLPAAQELVWLDDPVEAFFLQVQGSGRIRLRDGSILRVGFADHNGRPYRAIGAELIARGALARDRADAPAIKAWLRAHPAQAREVMQSNPRYVFFRELAAPADSGPPGSLGVPLTPMRSLATDPAFVPPGALMYLQTRYPDDRRPLSRAMLSQDRGAAIVGGVRADIFFGTGDEAQRLAGLMKEPGRIWLLRPRPDESGAPPRQRATR